MIGCAHVQRDGGPVADGLVEPDHEVARAVVGPLDRVDLDARVIDGHQWRLRLLGPTAGDHAQRTVERLGLVQHLVQAGAVGQERDGDLVAAVVGGGVRVLRGPQQRDADRVALQARGRSGRR